jgi:hypothetical protein
VVLATKVAGPSAQMEWIRGGPPRVDAAAITTALDGSLSRLRTDHVDLLQLHWPDRYVPMFGDVDFDPCACPLCRPQLHTAHAVQPDGGRRVGFRAKVRVTVG